MRVKKLVSALAAAGFALMTAGSASADITWFAPITAFQDDNIDYVVDNNNDGIVNVGDRLISVLEYGNSQGIFAGQGPNGFGTQELTGIADITVIGIVGSQLVFGPSGASGVLSGFAAGTMAAIFLDSSPDLNVTSATCGTRANCLTLAGLGGSDGSSVFLTAGFTGDPDELWVSSPEAANFVIADVQKGGSSTKFGDFNFSIGAIVNNTGKDLLLQACAPFCKAGGDGFVEITGSGDILGGQGLIAAEWTARSDSDAQVSIPEPGTVALFGLALAGLGAMRRRGK